MESLKLGSKPQGDKCVKEVKGSLKKVESINDLPVEMLCQVFAYLTHTQKLIVRLVCTHWNTQISRILQIISYFVVNPQTSQVILDSDVEWTKIIFSYTGYAMPKKSWSLITTLQIQVFGLREFLEVPVKFPHLTWLELNIHEDKSKPEDSVKGNFVQDHLRVQFKKIVEKLKIFSLEFQYNEVDTADFKTLCEFLKEFDAPTMVLTELRIIEVGCRAYDPDRSDFVTTMLSEVYRIIYKSNQTLLFLDLQFGTPKGDATFFPELISKLSDLKDLNLRCAWIESTNFPWMDGDNNENTERNFTIHKEFLLSQMDEKSVLKSVSLPWSPNPASCEGFIRSLPQGIELVSGVDKDHNLNQYISSFKKLKTMTLHSKEVPTFSNRCSSLRKLIISNNMGILQHQHEPASGLPFFAGLGTAFTNLVELHIEHWSHFQDWSLQLVIKHLKKLRSLHIQRAYYIHDFGVTGIEEEYSDELRKTRKLHLHSPVPKEKIVGFPLSSLKMLEEVVIDGADISDIGIFYGLQFGSSLKHLTIDSRGKISDWGLHWLGAGNPCLESFNGSFVKSARISSEGPDILRAQLNLIKSTQKFKMVLK